MKYGILSIAFFCVFGFASEAEAHASPSLYEPSTSAELSQSPERVSIRFSERVEENVSSITVYEPSGKKAEITRISVDAKDPYLLHADLQKISATGSYAVSWQVLSKDDGHFTKGGYVFFVGTKADGSGSIPAQFQILHQKTWGQGASAALEFIGFAIALGSILLGFLLRHTLALSAAYRLRWLLLFGTLCMIIGSSIYSGLETSNIMVNQGLGAMDSFKLFLQTSAGVLTICRVLSEIVLFGVPCANLRKIIKFDTRSFFVALIPLLSIAFFRSRLSHAAASNVLPTFSILITYIHLLAKSAWVGSSVAFFAIAKKGIEKNSWQKNYASYSLLISIALGIVGVTGAYIIWLDLKDFAHVQTSEWGQIFVALTILSVLLLIIRSYLMQFLHGKQRTPLLAIGAEATVGLFVVFFSGLLIVTTPPIDRQPVFEQMTNSTQGKVIFGQHPFETDKALIDYRAIPGGKLQSQDVTVLLTNEEENIGPIVQSVEQRSDKTFVFPLATLTPPGHWKIETILRREGGYDLNANFQMNYPADLQKGGSADRVFGLFELITIVIGIFLAAVAFFFIQKSWITLKMSSKIISPAYSDQLLPLSTVLAILAFFCAFIGYEITARPLSALARNCFALGDMWHSNTPMRNGQPTAFESISGCMVGAGLGQYHFADNDEYLYFKKPAIAIADLQAPSDIEAGEEAEFIFTVRDKNGKQIDDLIAQHDQFLHAIIVGQDLETFAHVHPTLEKKIGSSTFVLHYKFPKAGRYVIGLNFSRKANALSQEFLVNVEGKEKLDSPNLQLVREGVFDGYQVRLSTTPSRFGAKFVARATFEIFKDGKPVQDLEPYLAAPMHIALLRQDLHSLVHTHGLFPESFLKRLLASRNPLEQQLHAFMPNRFSGPIETYLTFTTTGKYVVFVEFKHNGKVIVSRFVVEAEKPSTE